MDNPFSDEYFMRMAMNEAMNAFEQDEIPVGAIIVSNNRILAKTHNLTETLTDVTAHAEMQAITSAANYLGGKYLQNCTMYVTLEPCIMCGGALYWSQITKVVYGASDPQRGFKSKMDSLHPKTEIVSGILAEECGELMKAFFKRKR